MSDATMLDSVETVGPRLDGARARVAIATLGCKVNQVDSLELQESLGRLGFRVVPFGSPAELTVVNTCTVTHRADRKSRQLIRQARRANPEGVVAITGCYAESRGQSLAEMAELDLVAGVQRREGVLRLAGEMLERGMQGRMAPSPGAPEETSRRTRAFIKVQDGCNNACAYCIIPSVRGRERSVPPETVAARVRELVEQGCQEVVLAGINLGAYGRDLRERGRQRLSLAGLLERLLRETEVARLRLSSLQPQDVDEALVELLGELRFCPSLHLPLQSGSETVLRRMGRRCGAARYAELVAALRRRVPRIAIATDVIVGFPGETEAEFEESYAFCEALGFARIHVFPYSRRQGTRAANLPGQVPESEKARRCRLMGELAQRSQRAYNASFVGDCAAVLFEEPALPGEGLWQGWSEHYVRVYAQGDGELGNRLERVRLLSPWRDGLRGELVALSGWCGKGPTLSKSGVPEEVRGYGRVSILSHRFRRGGQRQDL